MGSVDANRIKTTSKPASRRKTTPVVTQHWVTLKNNRNYRYVTAGQEEGQTIVFLHGYTDSWRSFQLILPLLENSYRLVILDQRGHGDTGDKFNSFLLNDFVADAIAFISEVANESVVLVGHSLGSIIAQRVAAARPDLVDKLILIGSTDTLVGNSGLKEFLAAVQQLPEPIPDNFIREFQAGTVHHQIEKRQFAIFVSESKRVSPRVWKEVLAALVEDQAITLDGIEAPTLILWGERDEIFNATSQERLNRSIRGSKLIIYPETGHAPHWEQPNVVARHIRHFIG